MRRLVLLGGGHAHVEVLRELAADPAARVEATLVTPSPRLIYTGMLPGHIAGHYPLEECTIDLAALARRAGARLALTKAALVSPELNEVACADGSAFGYDVLSLDVGSQPAIGEAQGVEKHAVLLRPLERALEGWNAVYARALEGEVSSVTVVGGGAGGIELALAMNHRFRTAFGKAAPHVRLVSDAPGTGITAGAARRLAARMRRDGIELHVGHAVVEVGEDHVRLKGGLRFATDAVFWATGGVAPDWIRDSGFATDARGFLRVNERLQSLTHPNVFGAGDCVSREDQTLPKAGVFAVRAAPVLAHNLRAALQGGELQPHLTKPRFLALVSTGERHAVGSWGPLAWQGRWVWRWKDRIDRRFVAKYREAPAAG